MKRIITAIIRLVLSAAAMIFIYLPLNQVTVYLNDVSGVRVQETARSLVELLEGCDYPQFSWILPLALAVSAVLALLTLFPVVGKIFKLIGSVVFAVAMTGFIAALVWTGFQILRF